MENNIKLFVDMDGTLTEFNGGFCTRMNDMVHITDGCTSSPDLEKR